MFDSLVAAADGTCGAGAAGAWARVENAACARRLAATADMLEARWAADGSAEREQWCLDNWDAVAAEVAAAQHVSHTTHPGSRLMFPTLCKPTAPVSDAAVVTGEPNRGLAMPRRTRTGEQNRQRSIEAERRLNDTHDAERNKPPPA